MKKQVSITDIARMAGVSTSTVSHVLNKTRYVSPEITERVTKAIAETDYRKNMLARALRQNKTQTVGIVLPSISTGTFYGKALESIEDALNNYGYKVIMQASGNDAEKERAAVEYLLSWNVDGMIIVLSNNDFDYSTIPCPVVLIDRAPNHETVSGFYVDNYSIACQVMERMIEKGYRQIGLISPVPIFAPTKHRVKGYRDTLEKHGIAVREELICLGKAVMEDGERFARYLTENTDAEAVLLTSSPMTVGAMNYLNMHGVKVPEQMAVVTFADYDWMPLSNPPLSGIVQPNREIGKRAAEQLYRHLQGEKEIVSQFLACEFFEGKSI